MITSHFITTRERAVAEFKAEVRSARRRNQPLNPAYAARCRRVMADVVWRNAKKWQEQSAYEQRRLCLLVARGHLIIARCYDRMTERN